MGDRHYDNLKDLLLLGAGGHALVIIETLRMFHSQYSIIGVTDKDELKTGAEISGLPVIGTDGLLKSLYGSGLRKAFVSIGAVTDFTPRIKAYNLALAAGFELINVIHGTSFISGQAEMGCGNAVLANAVINAGARIGNNCIINTGSIIEHECTMGNNVHAAPGSIICGGAVIGDNCLIGAGSTIIQGVKIGEDCIIGAGSVVIGDIPPGSMAVGVPARLIGKR